MYYLIVYFIINFFIINYFQIRRYITPLEIMASLIGAVAHDLDHPGVNQHFLISTSNHLAILYQVSISTFKYVLSPNVIRTD